MLLANHFIFVTVNSKETKDIEITNKKAHENCNHDHDHHHGGLHVHHHGTGNISTAFFLNLIFTVIELIGGIYTNSLAILSDALHDLGDSLSLGLAWYFEKLSHKEKDQQFTYGYKRFSILGALLNCIVLIIGSFFIVKAAIPRLFNPQEADAKGMLILAILGVLFNGAAFLKLRGEDGFNQRTISLHLLEDVLGWVAVLIGSIIIYFTDWYIIDPILSVMIALFILYNVFKNLKGVITILLQATPQNIDLSKVKEKLKSIEGVLDFHDLHVWTLDGDKTVMTVHIVTQQIINESNLHELKKRIHTQMRLLKISHCTIEIEFEGEECQVDC